MHLKAWAAGRSTNRLSRDLCMPTGVPPNLNSDGHTGRAMKYSTFPLHPGNPGLFAAGNASDADSDAGASTACS